MIRKRTMWIKKNFFVKVKEEKLEEEEEEKKRKKKNVSFCFRWIPRRRMIE